MHIPAAEKQRSRVFPLAVRLLLMVALVGALITGSTWTRRWPAGQALTVWVNILYFVVLGAADEWLLAPVLDRWPLGRAAMLAGETLSLGWFFAPGRVNPASKMLFFAHVGPFFLAVFGGALSVALIRRRQAREG